MTDYSKYKESAFTHEEMQPMIIETDMTDIVERLLLKKTLETVEDVHVLFADAAAEIELMRHALACVVLYWDEWKDAPEDHPTALSLEEVVDMCRAHLGRKSDD